MKSITSHRGPEDGSDDHFCSTLQYNTNKTTSCVPVPSQILPVTNYTEFDDCVSQTSSCWCRLQGHWMLILSHLTSDAIQDLKTAQKNLAVNSVKNSTHMISSRPSSVTCRLSAVSSYQRWLWSALFRLSELNDKMTKQVASGHI